jgi:hypothetical protein
MATPSLSPSFAIAILARQAAIKAVKADLWARGAKLSYISPREIRVIANEYLAGIKPNSLHKRQRNGGPSLNEIPNFRSNTKASKFSDFGCADVRADGAWWASGV